MLLRSTKMDAIKTYFIHIPNAFPRFQQDLTDKIALVGFLAVLDSFSSIKRSVCLCKAGNVCLSIQFLAFGPELFYSNCLTGY